MLRELRHNNEEKDDKSQYHLCWCFTGSCFYSWFWRFLSIPAYLYQLSSENSIGALSQGLYGIDTSSGFLDRWSIRGTLPDHRCFEMDLELHRRLFRQIRWKGGAGHLRRHYKVVQVYKSSLGMAYACLFHNENRSVLLSQDICYIILCIIVNFT